MVAGHFQAPVNPNLKGWGEREVEFSHGYRLVVLTHYPRHESTITEANTDDGPLTTDVSGDD